MSNKNPSCHFHPNRDAITKCEHCGKLICVECKNVYRKSHSSGSGDNMSYYYTHYDLCSPCFYDQKIKALNPVGSIFLIISGILIIIFSLSMFSFMIIPPQFPASSFPQLQDRPVIPSFNTFSFIMLIPFFFGIVFIIIGIILICTAPRKKDALKAKKELFLESISLQSQEQIEDILVNNLYCPLCGAQEDINAKYCSKCGSTLRSVKI
ncbi:MAG: B-box zinc finger protein [Promethearchaeota archaeon]